MDRKTDLRLWAVLFWLAVWQIAAMALAAVYPHGELLLASPVDVLLRLGQLAVTAAFWRTVAWSAIRIFGGFLLATVLAVALAALAAWKQWLRGLMAPLVAAVKAVPVASFIILVYLWLPGRWLTTFISALMVFPPVYLNLLEGLARRDRALAEMARVFRVPWGRRFWRLDLPQLLPYLRSAMSLGLGLCWKAGVAAEVIGVVRGSLGERLYESKIYFEMPELFAWTVSIVALSALFERLAMAGLERLGRKAGGPWN